MNREFRSDFSPEKASQNLHRRAFIRRSAAIASGIATGVALVPVSDKVNQVTHEVTGHRAGNPGTWKITEYCQKNPQDESCTPLDEYSISKKTIAIIFGEAYAGIFVPYVEERIFRDIPSGKFFKDNTSAGKGLTRREVTVGIGSSAAFGLAHNVFAFDASTIPASQTVCGLGFWYLQRKFGFASNFLAHATINTTAILSGLLGKSK